jgi:hypothetical protein
MKIGPNVLFVVLQQIVYHLGDLFFGHWLDFLLLVARQRICDKLFDRFETSLC